MVAEPGATTANPGAGAPATPPPPRARSRSPPVEDQQSPRARRRTAEDDQGMVEIRQQVTSQGQRMDQMLSQMQAMNDMVMGMMNMNIQANAQQATSEAASSGNPMGSNAGMPNQGAANSQPGNVGSNMNSQGIGFSPTPPPGFPAFQGGNQGNQPGGFFGRNDNVGNDFHKVLLEEKYFRRIDKFKGDQKTYRGWLFDLSVALGWVDGNLSDLIRNLCIHGYDEKWDPTTCVVINANSHTQSIYAKCKTNYMEYWCR